MLLRLPRRSASLAAAAGAASAALVVQRRRLEYWGLTVTGRTQPYAQGDMLPRVDNTKHVVSSASAAAAGLTGNQNNAAYDSSNIFSPADYSAMEGQHYQPFRGSEKYVIDPIHEKDGAAAAQVMCGLMEPEVEVSLEYLWWARLLKDFPSLRKPVTPTFKKAWQDFYIAALRAAHDDAAVTELARPFLAEQMQRNFIGQSMVWRIAEKLGDALESAPRASHYERRASRVAVERATKLLLNTLADEPWAHYESTNPLYVDLSGFRAWHEAKNW